ncbi:MAG: hypothetical protein AAB516_00660 [Patescibacteria group bacterium]
MKIFQNKLFIFFLILAVTFVALPKITQAGDVISFVAAWAMDTIVLTIGAILPLAPLALLWCGLGGPVGNCDDWVGGSGSGGPTTIDIGAYGCLFGVPFDLPVYYTVNGSCNGHHVGASFRISDYGPWLLDRDGTQIDSFSAADYGEWFNPIDSTPWITYVDKTALPDSNYIYTFHAPSGVPTACCSCGKTDCNAWCATGDISPTPIPVTTPSCTSPSDEKPMATVEINKRGCDYIEFSITPTPGSEAANYDVYRDGKQIASQVPIPQTIYKDAGLSKGASYSYTIDVRSGTNLIQTYGPISSSTSCIPDCDFSANPENLVYPATNSNLLWSCQGAVSCSISEVGDVCNNQTACETGDTTPVTVDKTTTFVFTCENSDGDKSFSTATVNVSRPTIIEVPPR